MRTLAKRCLQAENCSENVEVSILLTDNAHIAELNLRYRGIDAPTDVLAFALTEDDDTGQLPGEPVVLGDVVISVETAERQAAQQGQDLQDEMDVLLVHGLLHLVGYDHADPEQERIMFAKQEEVLGRTQNTATERTPTEGK